MASDGLSIRRVSSFEEYRRCEDLQRRVWGMGDTELVPSDLLVTAQRNGGLVLGAYDDRGEMIGFLFGFLGASAREEEEGAIPRWKHTSHIVAVLPEYRDQGVGYRLKLRQREFVLEQGLDLITWTYDPLESRNGYFNIAKLGAVCQTYIRNAYGEMSDALNVGLSSDRFQVDWWITSGRVAERIDRGPPPLSLETAVEAGADWAVRAEIGESGHPVPAKQELDLTSAELLIEIPPEFQLLKAEDLSLARAWRDQTRAVFERCFASGYQVEDFLSEVQHNRRRSAYLLRRRESPTEPG